MAYEAAKHDHDLSIGAAPAVEAAAVVKLGHDIGERTIIASLHQRTAPVILNAAPAYAVVACQHAYAAVACQQLMLPLHASHS